MKKILSLILCLAILIMNANLVFANESEIAYNDKISPIMIEDIVYDVNKNLTENQIAQRFQTINTTYEIGQPFSDVDSEFVRAYAKPVNQSDTVSALTTGNVDNIGSANGVYGRIYGTIFSNLAINNTFGGNLTGTAASTNYTINKLTITVQCMAYGVVGSDGIIGLVYDKTISASGTSSPVNFNKTQPYTAVAIYANVACWLDIEYNNGSILRVTGWED